MYILM